VREGAPEYRMTCGSAVAAAILSGRNPPPASDVQAAGSSEELNRRRLFAELQPVRLPFDVNHLKRQRIGSGRE